jgi:hypothetical protein
MRSAADTETVHLGKVVPRTSHDAHDLNGHIAVGTSAIEHNAKVGPGIEPGRYLSNPADSTGPNGHHVTIRATRQRSGRAGRERGRSTGAGHQRHGRSEDRVRERTGSVPATASTRSARAHRRATSRRPRSHKPVRPSGRDGRDVGARWGSAWRQAPSARDAATPPQLPSEMAGLHFGLEPASTVRMDCLHEIG